MGPPKLQYLFVAYVFSFGVRIRFAKTAGLGYEHHLDFKSSQRDSYNRNSLFFVGKAEEGAKEKQRRKKPLVCARII